jgi:hypothetical protein
MGCLRYASCRHTVAGLRHCMFVWLAAARVVLCHVQIFTPCSSLTLACCTERSLRAKLFGELQMHVSA